MLLGKISELQEKNVHPVGKKFSDLNVTAGGTHRHHKVLS
jgi:hypothetical protein